LGSKSTFSNSTSRSYALALYEISEENSELNKIEADMKELNLLLEQNTDFKEMILNPAVTKKEKRNVMLAIADKKEFSENLKKFLGFVAVKNRLFYLNNIIQSFLDLTSSSKGELKAKLISSKKLSIDEKKKIQGELSKDFQSSLKIDYKYDPNLIAGLIIQVGSIMIDTSIKTKLKKLEKNMLEA